MAAMSIIRAEKIAKCFRIYRHPSDHLKELLFLGRRRFHEPFWAVRDVDVQVERGCCLGIIGENGSGKSTLLRMIAGVIRPSSGNIAVGGRVSALLVVLSLDELVAVLLLAYQMVRYADFKRAGLV